VAARNSHRWLSHRRRPLVNQQATYPDPHVAHKGQVSGVVCVVEIKAQFWDSYKGAFFDLRRLRYKIGPGGVMQ
jgi:hypothetical protein